MSLKPTTPDQDAAPSLSIDDDAEVRAVREIADVLERVRSVCAEISLATLTAQVHNLPPEVICAVLEELANAGERALDALAE